MALLFRLKRNFLNVFSRFNRTFSVNLLGDPHTTPDARELTPLTSFRENVISSPLFNSTLKLHTASL